MYVLLSYLLFLPLLSLSILPVPVEETSRSNLLCKCFVNQTCPVQPRNHPPQLSGNLENVDSGKDGRDPEDLSNWVTPWQSINGGGVSHRSKLNFSTPCELLCELHLSFSYPLWLPVLWSSMTLSDPSSTLGLSGPRQGHPFLSSRLSYPVYYSSPTSSLLTSKTALRYVFYWDFVERLKEPL